MGVRGANVPSPDDNRRRVVDQDYLPAIIHQLHDPHLVPVALGVIYNICLDYGVSENMRSGTCDGGG